MKTFVFRAAQYEDWRAIRDLTRAAYAKWLPVIGREPKPMGADYEAAVRNHRIDLLFDGDDLPGLIEMIARPSHLLVENVAVALHRQGQGLGHRLMARAEEAAMELGYSELRPYTHHRFVENIRLYAALGYAIDSQEPIADGFRVNLSKRLAGGG